MNGALRLLIYFSFFIQFASAADLPRLKKLYEDHFDDYYDSRFCGRNTARLLTETVNRGINLSNSYVLKIVGAGTLETSGFILAKM